jgi:hypothetical protein
MKGTSEEVMREELVHIAQLAKQTWLGGKKGGECT